MSISPISPMNTLLPLDNSTAAAAGASTSGTSSTTNSTSASSATSNETSQLDNPQMFLQLLISELQNQDPTNPTDPSTILQQTSELAQMESVNTQQATALSTEATNLVGRTVTANLSGSPVTGIVTDVNLSSTGTPTLTVNGSTIALADVTEVSSGSSSTTTASAGTGSG